MKGGINPRSRWEIILDILRVISQEERESEGKEKKTRVMQRAYLDWWSFQRLKMLILRVLSSPFLYFYPWLKYLKPLFKL
ncbi:MAG: hypothetical protein GH149_00125 [Methanosarcinales archaeon]|nr:hypothetical protein [Methanosarcinales archaeon]